MTRHKKLNYIGDIVLGMHDALVSLTGLIAGMAFVTDDRKIIILSAIIASVAASLSMAASNYLATRTDEYETRYCDKSNAKLLIQNTAILSAAYTGGAYMLTCVVLILPFVFIQNTMTALGITFVVAILIIFLFNWCVCKMRHRPWLRPFFEMLVICAGVSIAAFVIGETAKYFLGIYV